jgi:hypothetical protein
MAGLLALAVVFLGIGGACYVRACELLLERDEW